MTSTAPVDYRLDLESTFDRHWIAVARTSELDGKGAYLTRTIGTEPLIVLRNGKGELRAHLNVCRHRGSQILEGAGRVKGLMCPYHGWMYSLDGELRGAPEMKYTECFDKREFPLVSFQVLEWAGFAMVSMKPASPDPVGAELDGAVVRELATAAPAHSWRAEVEGDWRQVLAGIAGALPSSWSPSLTGDVLEGIGAVDVQSCFLVRPGLLLVRHGGVWSCLSVMPGAPGHTLLIGDCLVPGQLPSDDDGVADAAAGPAEATTDIALIKRSKQILQPGSAGDHTPEVEAASIRATLEHWVAADRVSRPTV